MKEKAEKSGNGTKQVKALDDMEKQVAKAEKAAKAEANKAKRLEKATERLENLKKGKETVGFANSTLNLTHSARALNVSVQGAIDALNLLIKEVSKAAALDKKTVAALKGEAAKSLLSQITEATLPLYIDAKGLYRTEALYRLVASKAKNSELRTLLNNINKSNK